MNSGAVVASTPHLRRNCFFAFVDVVTGIYETYVFQPHTICGNHQNRP